MFTLLFVVGAVTVLVGTGRLWGNYKSRRMIRQHTAALEALGKLTQQDPIAPTAWGHGHPAPKHPSQRRQLPAAVGGRDPFTGMVRALRHPKRPPVPPGPGSSPRGPGSSGEPSPTFVFDFGFPPAPSPNAGPPGTASVDTHPRRDRRRLPWVHRPAGALPRAAALVTVLAVAAAVAVVTVGLTGGRRTPASSPVPSPRQQSPAPKPLAPVTQETTPPDFTGAPDSTVVTETPTVSAPLPSTTVDGPVLSSISPPGGVAGQTVTLTGSHFFSPDGRISVTFGPSHATTSCPTVTTCNVTVPARGPFTTVMVTVTTAAGTSNGLPFSYT